MKPNVKALSGGICCSVYEKERETKFRDQLRFYIDGKIVFERYCYGEAAGMVASLVSDGFDDSGKIVWKIPNNLTVPGNPPPAELTNASYDFETLEFDGQFKKYKRLFALSSDGARGYSKIRLFFIRRKAEKNS